MYCMVWHAEPEHKNMPYEVQGSDSDFDRNEWIIYPPPPPPPQAAFYRCAFPRLIAHWRQGPGPWERTPFVFVQVAPWRGMGTLPFLRHAQALALAGPEGGAAHTQMVPHPRTPTPTRT